jgi:hypothetical protein
MRRAVLAPVPYFPPAGFLQHRDPAALGFDPAKLDAIVAYAGANQNPNTQDLAVDIVNTFRDEDPCNNLIGPTQPPTRANGVAILRPIRGGAAAELFATLLASLTQ